MHPDRRTSDGNAGANGDLLRQVLTRNFLSVAYDPDEFTGHLRGASRFSYHSNDNNNFKNSNFILKDFEATDDNEANYSTSSYYASNSLTVLQTTTPATDGKILVPAELSVSHDNKNSSTHAGQPSSSHGRSFQHNSKSGPDLYPNHQHQKLTDRISDAQDTSCRANSLNSAGYSQLCFEDFSNVNEINIDESDFCYSRVKNIANKDSEETESRGNFTDFQLSFPQSAPCTAFPFPSPKELYPSETTSCFKFCDEQNPTLKLHKAKPYTKDLANCDASSEQEEEDYDNQLSSSAEILSANLMPPPKGLPTSRDLHHLRQSTEVSHTADDDDLAEAKDSFKHLASRRESFCRKSNNLRITSDSGVRRSIGSVSPKLVRRCDLIFGAVIGKGAFGKVHKGSVGGTVASEPALRSARTLLSRVRAPPSVP
ncbi:hypothetical protein PoB_001385400 [Plakobranchus ocellatus]|uniref:Protein kinase domain-containing protein n=1 Tax=Plakobranchus ocellatus TaxID=259542 RepID=A0AAV3YZ01_9GAST|nr:hypothetical protein PoB_001385400 [Plakobranchus ocellatus]